MAINKDLTKFKVNLGKSLKVGGGPPSLLDLVSTVDPSVYQLDRIAVRKDKSGLELAFVFSANGKQYFYPFIPFDRHDYVDAAVAAKVFKFDLDHEQLLSITPGQYWITRDGIKKTKDLSNEE